MTGTFGDMGGASEVIGKASVEFIVVSMVVEDSAMDSAVDADSGDVVLQPVKLSIAIEISNMKFMRDVGFNISDLLSFLCYDDSHFSAGTKVCIIVTG